jgi:hypothetical protein
MKTTKPVTDTYSHGFAKIDPVEYFRSIVANLWDTVAVMLCAGSKSEEDFRTINVQWIGQWGLFSLCGISQNQ